MEDLVVAARAVDLDAPAEALRTGRRLGLQGVVANPCSEPVVLTSPKICLAESFTLVDSSGKTRGGGTPCAESGGRWELPVQGARTVTFVLGSLPSGEYSAAVPFTFSGAEAAVDFQIGN